MDALRRHKGFFAYTTLACGAIFLWAIIYCQLDAFVPHPGESSHQEASAEHQDGTLPTPGHDEASLHCNTVQSLIALKFDVLLNPVTAQPFQATALESLQPDAFGEPFRLASGLSPPTRAPTPRTPFYRTTYANHAPPVRLA